jgi:glycosyltransferase involved in cell wall biosynthesis
VSAERDTPIDALGGAPDARQKDAQAKRRLRVLFVIGNLNDYHVPRYEALAQLAASRGHELSLVEVFGKSGVYRFPQERRAAFFDSRPSNAVTLLDEAEEADGHWSRIGTGLLEALQRISPHVVVTLGYSTSYSLFLCLHKLVKKRFALIYMSDSKTDDGKRYAIKERLKRVLVSRFDAALVAGEKHRAYAKSLGIPMSRSRIGFDVIDVEYFSQAAREARARAAEVRENFGLPARYIMCVSRFVQRKNIGLLIDAFAQSGVHSEGISMVLVGQGPREREIREEIGRKGLSDQVVILNSVANQNMPCVYSLAEFIVLASAFDQWGLCVNEAFAAGKPAIVTRTCGVANELVLEGETGFIVEPGDVSALANRMRQLATNTVLRERLSQNAAVTIERWTPTLFATNVIELVESMGGMARARDPQSSRPHV